MERVTGCTGKVFFVLNLIFLIIGIGLLAYSIWILESTGNISVFGQGTLAFTYTFLSLGFVISLAGLFGCIAVCAESGCSFKWYIGVMVFIMLVDVAVVAVVGYLDKSALFDTVYYLWDEINDDTKDKIQKELKCCGYSDSTEYGTSIPSSCYSGPNTVYPTSCHDAIEYWVKNNIPVWASILSAIVIIQIISSILSCVSLRRINKAMRLSPAVE